jgi:predicted ATPase/transcriptional regulator with XRE-family HTH domain
VRDLTTFAQWLKRQRRALDLTRAELAQRAHCSASALYRLETGDLRASRQLAEALAAAVGIPAEQLEAFVQFARGECNEFPVTRLHSSIPGLPPDTASLSTAAPPNNLPAHLTGLVGRRREISALCDLLSQPGVRLLTLSGPPGIGKTRLSLAVAWELAQTSASIFPDGIYFIPLATCQEADRVALEISRTLGVREGRDGLFQALQAFLRPRRLLLVLDNFEQIMTAAPTITDLLAAAADVKALVTSRELLRVYGEHEFPVAPLSLPDVNRLPTVEAAAYYAHFSAIQLFKERARAVRPDFSLTSDNVKDVARICAWLDGLPLAIEMAAAQVKWLPTGVLFEQLSHRLETLTGGPRDLSPRQQSLRGAIDWSYHLLDPDERWLFNALSVFAGGCDEEALADLWVAGGQDLSSHIRRLMDKSLLRQEITSEGGMRVVMLETIREYACEQLQACGEWQRLRQAHAEHYLKLARDAKPHLMAGGDQVSWLNRLEREHTNLCTALGWAAEIPGRAQFAFELTEAMFHFWYGRGYFSEARHWLETVLALDETPSELRARLLNRVGEIARPQGDYAAARGFHEQALIIQEQLGDEPGIARSLESLAILAGCQGDYVRAGELLEDVLTRRRQGGDTWQLITALNNLALVMRRLGAHACAEQLYRESAEFCRAANKLASLGHALFGLGEIRVALGEDAASLAFFRECIAIRCDLGSRAELAAALYGIAVPLYHLGDGATAARLLSASARLREETGQVITPANRAEWEEIITQVRASLGATAFERAWAEGQKMSLDDAVALALGRRCNP